MLPRVLHITGRSDHGGGPEHILQVLRSSDAASHALVACPRQGVYWSRFAAVIGEARLVPIPHRALSVRALAELILAVRRHRVQVIHSHGMSAGVYGRVLARLTGLPCVHSFHGLPTSPTFKHRVYDLAEGLLSRWTTCAIAVSASEAALAAERFPQLQGRLRVVPNGIELADPPPPAAGPERRVVSFTRLNRQKNPHLVLDIAEDLRRRGVLGAVRFHLYGEGVAGTRFRRAVAERGLSARVRCHAPTDDPRAVLAGAWCYLSTSRWEGMPLSLIEAARDGVPIVASAVVGNADLIEHGGDGLLFAQDDAPAAAAALHGLLADPQLGLRLAAAARQRFLADNTAATMTRHLTGVYRRQAAALAG